MQKFKHRYKYTQKHSWFFIFWVLSISLFITDISHASSVDPEILNQMEEWANADLEILNERILFTHNDFLWKDRRAGDLAQAMRTEIISKILSTPKNTAALKYLVHYLNIDHSNDSDNYTATRGMAGLGFIPKSKINAALEYINENAGSLSTEELAQLVAMDSLAGSSTANVYAFPGSIQKRLQQEKGIPFILSLIKNLQKFPPTKPHPAFSEIEKRVSTADFNVEDLVTIELDIEEVDNEELREKLRNIILPILSRKPQTQISLAINTIFLKRLRSLQQALSQQEKATYQMFNIPYKPKKETLICTKDFTTFLATIENAPKDAQCSDLPPDDKIISPGKLNESYRPVKINPDLKEFSDEEIQLGYKPF